MDKNFLFMLKMKFSSQQVEYEERKILHLACALSLSYVSEHLYCTMQYQYNSGMAVQFNVNNVKSNVI